MLIRVLCAVGVFAISLSTASAQTKSPFRFVPPESELVLKVDRPRELLTAIETNPAFVDAKKLAGVRDLYDTTTYQQLYQLISHFEKQLGKSRDELLDDLGAGGIVIAAKLTKPGGALLVLQAADDARLRRAVELGLDVLGQELERQESKDKIVRKKYEGLDVGQIGKVSFAIVDAALIVGTDEKVLKASLDGYRAKKTIQQSSSFTEAHQQAPAKALAWAWMNFEELRKNPEFQNGLNAASLDPLQTLLFGGFADLLKRTPYGTATITREGDDYRIRLAAPRGVVGMSAFSHVIVPPKNAGTAPLLLPPRVLSSTSFYLDLGQYWDKRVDILGEKNAKGIEDGNQNVGKLTGGITLAKLFKAAGPHHRLVFAQQKEHPYKIQPNQKFPSFALVVNMRDPAFAKDMDKIFRTGAAAATLFVGLQLDEQTHKDVDITTYYFSETKKVDFDQQNIRYNFSPSYATVGDQLIVSATVELAKDLIDLLKEEKQPKLSVASMRTKLFAAGVADLVRANEDTTLTQLILGQALPPRAAREELGAIINWIDRLGTLQLESIYAANDFRYDIIWQAKKR